MVDPWGKYSEGEYERRFLLRHLPSEVAEPRRIRDYYLTGTRLRLRLVEDPDGELLERKLGHKRRVVEDEATAIMHTSLYLDSGEFEALTSLPGRSLTKVRWDVDLDGQAASVDVFEGYLLGLVMLEVDLKSPTLLAGFLPPDWAGPEVTQDETFTGGALSRLPAAGLQQAVAPYLENHQR
ncbi:MAG: hypothetical protein VX833_04630 [Actinomycetota bacterium]|nr:hypothetical protein [Actinomycetota bacterium]